MATSTGDTTTLPPRSVLTSSEPAHPRSGATRATGRSTWRMGGCWAGRSMRWKHLPPRSSRSALLRSERIATDEVDPPPAIYRDLPLAVGDQGQALGEKDR